MLDRNIAEPLHAQLERILVERIANDEWAVNTAIPSENELCKEYGVSRVTVRGVIERLITAGLVYRVAGRGTFISEPKIVSSPLSHVGIRQQLDELGYENTTKLIEIKKEVAGTKLARILQIERGVLVNVVRRVRYVKGVPLSIHTSYIPTSICNNLETMDLEGVQLCDILEQEYGYEILKRVETLESVTAEEEEAGYLEVKRGFPLLRLENTVYAHNDKLIEYNNVLFRGDKIKITLSYKKYEKD